MVDYTTETFEPLMEHEINGLDYKYVYGNDRLSVDIWSVHNSGSIVENGDHIRLYYHMDYLGTADYLTSPVSGRVESWTHYNEWGEITHNAVVNCGQRTLDLVKRYATHDYDAVLDLYYAKARMYDAANRRFLAVDPILEPSGYDLREYVQTPVMLVQYLYVQDRPLVFIDPTGMIVTPANVIGALIGALGGYVIGDAIAKYFKLQGCARSLALAGSTGLLTVVGWFAGPAVYAAVQSVATKAVAAGSLNLTKTAVWVTNALGLGKIAAQNALANVGTFIVKSKHLLGAMGDWSKFNTVDIGVIRQWIGTALQNGTDFFVNSADSFYLIYDFGEVIGSNGETKIRIVFSILGKIITCFPVK